MKLVKPAPPPTAPPTAFRRVAPATKIIRAAAATDVMAFTEAQARYYLSQTRFNVVPAGRRSGKTAIAKRRLVRKALKWYGQPNTRFIASAPVHNQAKEIYWRDLKMMIPPMAMRRRPIETELTIELINGALIQVFGLDKPERVEGSPVGHIVVDEYGNMKPDVWEHHISPALTDSQGTADFIGAPEGRNHYHALWLFACGQGAELGEWQGHTWHTSEVLVKYLGEELARREIASAKGRMDLLTFQQEYEASFVNFEGRAYYPFDRQIHALEQVHRGYNPAQPLYFCFDFNRSPGVAVVCQDVEYPGRNPNVADDVTAAIDEVWIRRGSNTPQVAQQLLARYREHRGLIYAYGDASGGAKTSSSVQGSDWDILRTIFERAFGKGRVKFRVPASNPPERVRVNAVNARLQTADGKIHFLVDPKKCPHLVNDFEGVECVPGTSGDILKDPKSELTHISDAVGYMLVARFPISGDQFIRDYFVESPYAAPAAQAEYDRIVTSDEGFTPLSPNARGLTPGEHKGDRSRRR